MSGWTIFYIIGKVALVMVWGKKRNQKTSLFPSVSKFNVDRVAKENHA